jgi:hypothetical protein
MGSFPQFMMKIVIFVMFFTQGHGTKRGPFIQIKFWSRPCINPFLFPDKPKHVIMLNIKTSEWYGVRIAD